MADPPRLEPEPNWPRGPASARACWCRSSRRRPTRRSPRSASWPTRSASRCLRLVEVTDEPVVRRVTPADIAWLWRGRSKASAAGLVAGVEAPVPVELWEWRIGAARRLRRDCASGRARASSSTCSRARPPSRVDGVEVVVATGECAVFQADRPHRYASAHGRATRFVMVVVEPIEPPVVAAAAVRARVPPLGGPAAPAGTLARRPRRTAPRAAAARRR